jgi:hypothetical protein
MTPELKEVKANMDYTLLLTFHNGEVKVLDMKPYLDFGIFEELKDIQLFLSVKKSFDTVEWSNEADLDPEFLYNNSKKIATN